MSKGVIFDIRELTVHDGPGIRTTVFFKGCPLRCNWCHNPEGLSPKPELMIRQTGCTDCGLCKRGCNHDECKPFDRCVKICPRNLVQICGQEVDSETLGVLLKKNADIFTQTRGGVTISGGEPLGQPEFLLDLLQKLKPVHTAVETSGFGDTEIFMQTVKNADLILFDIKHMDPVQHEYWTGADNALIQKNLGCLISAEKSFVARFPLIPGVNDTNKNFEQMAECLLPARDRCVLEVLPYNRLAGAKYKSVSMEYSPGFDTEIPANFNSAAFDTYGIKWKIL